jgi:hypothetical protein
MWPEPEGIERLSTLHYGLLCALSVYVSPAHARVIQYRDGVSAFLRALCDCVFLSFSLSLSLDT